MIWLYPPVSFYYYTPIYTPVLGEHVMPFRQGEHVMPFRQGEPVQQIEPYLHTWPYSNTYYGNYYES